MTEGSAGRGAPVPVPKVRPGRPYPRYAVISVTAVTNTTLLKAKLRTCAFRNSLPSAGSKYVQGSAENPRFNLHAFWVDQKKQLPMHYGVYLTQVGCIRSAAASVETVFSGAGKFMDEAPGTGAKLLRGIVRCHHLYKYKFIRPSIPAAVARYNQKHHPRLGTAGAAAGAEVAAAKAAAEQPAVPPAVVPPDAAAAAGAAARAAAAAALAAGADPAAAAAAAANAAQATAR